MELCWERVDTALVGGTIALVVVKLGHHAATGREVVILHGLMNHLIALVNVGVHMLSGELAVADEFLEFADVCAGVVCWNPFWSPSGLVGAEIWEGGSGHGIECLVSLHLQLVGGKEASKACMGLGYHLLESLEDKRAYFSNILRCLHVVKW